MPEHYAKFIDATDRHEFQSELQKYLFRFCDDPFVDPASIRVNLALGPGPHFGAIISWVSHELDEIERMEREDQAKRLANLPCDPSEA